uniref:Uncharacterized protein n=1 Tax=Octopus bimaculoides TaxID=37653 RepID=A0A0L8G1V4_OCTBM
MGVSSTLTLEARLPRCMGRSTTSSVFNGAADCSLVVVTSRDLTSTLPNFLPQARYYRHVSFYSNIVRNFKAQIIGFEVKINFNRTGIQRTGRLREGRIEEWMSQKTHVEPRNDPCQRPSSLL